MSKDFDHWAHAVMSGHATGMAPSLLRIGLRVIEPIYTQVVAARNRLFDHNVLRHKRLPRPVISVGNLTTGGTGKTPVVQWLVAELLRLGHHPAVLLRGYRRAAAASASDEERLLRESLDVPVEADPDRFLAGKRVLAREPTVDVFVLDDGFQHRRLHRDMDIVLIDATNPFGYGHVLPRGMLRESVSGLGRADVVLLTRADLVDERERTAIERIIRGANPRAPIHRANHRLGRVRGDGVDADLDSLGGRRVFAFCGIGNPAAFERSLRSAGLDVVGFAPFRDHHAYEVGDLDELQRRAANVRADVLLTTEKDWAKLSELPTLGEPLPVLRVGVQIEIDEDARVSIVRLVVRQLAAGSPIGRVRSAL